MSTTLNATQTSNTEQTKLKQAIKGIRFDYTMSILGSLFITGLYIDGWAHGHGRVDNTFFTPWHAILYGSYALTSIVLVAVVIINHQRGYTWKEAIPDGYGWSLIGVPLFALGGVGDLIWHTLFGFEVGIEPLLSPTHLVLAASGMSIMSGPLRATLHRPRSLYRDSWVSLLPMLLSLTAVFSLFTFFTEFAHPFVYTWLVTDAVDDMQKSLGAANILLQAALLMGVVLFAVRRWRLPFGALTLLFTANIMLVSLFADEYRLIPSALIAGLAADLLLLLLKPTEKEPEALRVFAFVVPVVLYLGYFLTLQLTQSVSWSIHLWLGSSLLTGVVGLVLSYLLVPPREQTKQ